MPQNSLNLHTHEIYLHFNDHKIPQIFTPNILLDIQDFIILRSLYQRATSNQCSCYSPCRQASFKCQQHCQLARKYLKVGNWWSHQFRHTYALMTIPVPSLCHLHEIMSRSADRHSRRGLIWERKSNIFPV